MEKYRDKRSTEMKRYRDEKYHDENSPKRGYQPRSLHKEHDSQDKRKRKRNSEGNSITGVERNIDTVILRKLHSF